MKWLTKIALPVLALLSAAAAAFARMQGGRAKRAEAEAAAHREALAQVKDRAERLNKAADKTKNAEEKAHEQKKDLANTPDSGLASRANNLFKL